MKAAYEIEESVLQEMMMCQTNESDRILKKLVHRSAHI